MPESQHRYLFERLGDHDFQQLVNALLTHQYQDYKPMALRQADGGRDGLEWQNPENILIYQTKWSRDGKDKDPVSWLSQTVRKETDNLRDLANQGVRHYLLVTNVGSTARPKVGTYDRMQELFDEYALEFGFDRMECIWRETLNPWVDNAPRETKWAYADMLAGWDLIRYLVADEASNTKDQGLRDLVRKVSAAQWEEDQLVKFTQSDVDREKVVDLFVDVTAEWVSTVAEEHRNASVLPYQGAATYLLNTKAPFTLVRGAPGQGKSTLGQLVSQAHRRFLFLE